MADRDDSARPGENFRVHGTTVARGGVAALLRGPSGSGKSDLALRFVSSLPAFPPTSPGQHALVADDQTIIACIGDTLHVSCPETIAGRIEVRGLGILCCPALPSARLVLVVDLVASSAVERLPSPDRETFLGLSVARIVLAPFEASAPVKLALALEAAGRAFSPKP